MGRAPCCDKNLVKKGPWSPEEDVMLKAYIDAHGTGGNWIALPQKIGLKRCGKSCRLRWLNYLRPNIKHGGFSEEEDNTICSLYISIGSRWSVIAAQLPGRTDNDIKNYWNTKLKKKLLGRRKQSCHNISSYPTSQDTKDGMSDETQRLSNSALERLQLHLQLRNSPLSGPTLWPKLLHPAQEKMIQGLKAMQNDNLNPYLDLQQKVPYSNGLTELELSKTRNHDEFGISSNQIHSTMEGFEQLISPPSEFSSLHQQAEFENFIKNTNTKTTMVTGEYRNQKAHPGTSWWSNEMDTKSSASISSDSWDESTSAIGSGNLMMFHEYGLGYNM